MKICIQLTLFFLCLVGNLIGISSKEESLHATNTNQLIDIIQSFVNYYQRPFTSLHLGSFSSDISFAIAQDNEVVCVMADTNPGLLDACNNQGDLDNIILLGTLLSPEQLVHLGQCEHFDVIFYI